MKLWTDDDLRYMQSMLGMAFWIEDIPAGDLYTTDDMYWKRLDPKQYEGREWRKMSRSYVHELLREQELLDGEAYVRESLGA